MKNNAKYREWNQFQKVTSIKRNEERTQTDPKQIVVGALCPFNGGYFEKQTSYCLDLFWMEVGGGGFILGGNG